MGEIHAHVTAFKLSVQFDRRLMKTCSQGLGISLDCQLGSFSHLSAADSTSMNSSALLLQSGLVKLCFIIRGWWIPVAPSFY